MVHAGGHAQAAAPCRVDEDDPRVALEELLRLSGASSAAAARGSSWPGRRLVCDELRLDDDAHRRLERLDLVEDRRHRALGERDEPRRGDAYGRAGRRPPLDGPAQHAGAQVELALVRGSSP